MLLDEPSSNLDRNAINYVEKELKRYKGPILLISHDRSLLDEICTSIIEIAEGKVKKYEGNYTTYKLQKEAEIKRKEFEYIQYIEEKHRLEKAILIKKIMQQHQSIKINPNIKIGYFSQDFTNLNMHTSIIENVMKDTNYAEEMVKNILANLLFKDKDLNKKIKDLSGGERVKVSIAKILVSESNLLLLDEPTNFLDIPSIEALEDLLKKYNGTILLVTHDKTFIEHIATDIWRIRNHKIEEYEGNYSSYLQYEKEKLKKQKNNDENDRLLLEFKLSQISSELSITKDEKRKIELEEEFNRLIKLKHLTN